MESDAAKSLQKTKPKTRKSVLRQSLLLDQKQRKENYLAIHNSINAQFRTKQYKIIYERLLKIGRPADAYLSLYLEDIVLSVNKILKEDVMHKQIYSGDPQMYIIKGKDSLQKLYKLLIVSESIINGKMIVNCDLEQSLTRFLIITVAFTLKLCLTCVMLNKTNYAKTLYELLYNICLNISTSSTSNYKVLRKVGQALLIYAVFLINNKEFNRAIDVLFDCLKNQTNLLVILSERLKLKTKSEGKRRKLELYNRLYAIFYNLTFCFQQKDKLQLSFLCLRQCQMIANLKTKLLQKEIKLNWNQILKNYKAIYDGYNQLKKVVQVYFDIKEVKEDIQLWKRYQKKEFKEVQEIVKESTTRHSFQKAKQTEKKHKFQVRRSISLQESIDHDNNKRIYKDFGQEILFFGVNLFNKEVVKTKKCHTSTMKFLTNSNATQQQFSKSYLVNNNSNIKSKQQSKLKKRSKKIENTVFQCIRQPIQFSELQKRFQKTWIEQETQKNKIAQKRCLLKYKSQYLNNKQMAKENPNIYQQIQIKPKNTNEYTIKDKKLKPTQQEDKEKDKDKEKEKGINMFKSIILTHCKQFEIKKSETINILKKKRKHNPETHFESYTEPQESVEFLLEKLRKEKEKGIESRNKQLQRQQQLIEKNKLAPLGSNVFLTKDTIEIPSLFLSYITTTAFSNETIEKIVEHKQKQTKHQIQ